MKKSLLIPLIIIGVLLVFGIGLFVGWKIDKSPSKCKDEPEVKKEEVLTGKLSFDADDGGIPGTSYDVTIDFDNKVAKVKEYRHCSAEDCDGWTNTYENISLTNEELVLITKITKLDKFKEEGYYSEVKAELAEGLIYLYRGDKVYASKSENAKEYEWFKSYDTDNNGIVTNKEMGDNHLKNMLEEFK